MQPAIAAMKMQLAKLKASQGETVDSIGEVIDKFAAIGIDVTTFVRRLYRMRILSNIVSQHNDDVYIAAKYLSIDYNVKIESILTRGKDLDFILPKVDSNSDR